MELVLSTEESLERQIKDVKKRIAILNRNIREADDLVKSANQKLDEEHPDLSRQLLDLQNEVRTCQAAARANGTLKEDSPEAHNIDEDFLKPPSFEDDGNLEKSCKTLFRKLSKLCHPDVSEEDYSEVFCEAKEAMDILDYSRLRELVDEVEEGTNKREEKSCGELREELLALQKIWQDKLAHYNLQKSQNGYGIAKAYFSKDFEDNLTARQHYIFAVYERLKMLAKMLKPLKKDS